VSPPARAPVTEFLDLALRRGIDELERRMSASTTVHPPRRGKTAGRDRARRARSRLKPKVEFPETRPRLMSASDSTASTGQPHADPG